MTTFHTESNSARVAVAADFEQPPEFTVQRGSLFGSKCKDPERNWLYLDVLVCRDGRFENGLSGWLEPDAFEHITKLLKVEAQSDEDVSK